jgi:large subunit ribosomal protein L10
LAKSRAVKEKELRELEEKIRSSRGGIILGYQGLTAQEMHDLRRRLREEGAELVVTKNTFLSRVARAAGMERLLDFVEGPTAVAFGYDDPAALARALKEFSGEHEKLVLRGGYLEGAFLSPAEVGELASLPPRPVLLAQVVGALGGVLYRLVGTLQAPLQGFLGILTQLEERRKTGG